jgi:hypothetical protein
VNGRGPNGFPLVDVPIIGQHDRQLVAILEDLTRKARAGELVGVALVGIGAQGQLALAIHPGAASPVPILGGLEVVRATLVDLARSGARATPATAPPPPEGA